MVQVIKFPEPDDAMWAGIGREVVKIAGDHVDREIIEEAIQWARAEWERRPVAESLEFTLHTNSSDSAIQSKVQEIVDDSWRQVAEPLLTHLLVSLVASRVEMLLVLRERSWPRPVD